MKFKVLDKNGCSCNGGGHKWSLPKNGKPGEWTERIDNPSPCVQGWHYCEGPQVLDWLGEALYLLEVKRGAESNNDGDKVVTSGPVRLVRRLRWNEQISRRFACDCAERALMRERSKGREPDKRSWAVIRAARSFAAGKIDKKELAAAWDAAWSAARAAAWDAAWDAAKDAARAAARAAAWDAAKDAAWSAAWSAAKDAARDAAGDAAWSAAWSAAKDAAGDAERKWQYKLLLWYVGLSKGKKPRLWP